MPFAEVRAVLWAQARIARNLLGRRAASQFVVVAAMGAVWYGLWTTGAVMTAVFLARATNLEALGGTLRAALLLALAYWQFVPILMLSTGAAIDLKQVLPYPIPRKQLFGLDVLLRLSTASEVLIVLAGATVGLLRNPLLPWWAPAGFLPFAAMNLLAAVGVRSLLTRLAARRLIREIALVLFVLAAALPQIILLTGSHERVAKVLHSPTQSLWPWGAAGSIAAGQAGLAPWLALAFWTGLAYAFGRWQFERGLRFDRDEAGMVQASAASSAGWRDRLYRLPSMFLGDPLAALVEKEIRFLPRAPRFRLAFLMGFSFGLLIWLPMAARGFQQGGSFFADNYLTFVTIYAVLLLSEATFWNCLGFDRGAVQIYFAAAVPMWKVLTGKNLAVALVVLLEFFVVTIVCLLVRMPVTAAKLVEAGCVTAIFTLYALAIGNIGSSRYPRPIDPKQSWRASSASRFQALLMAILPIMAAPLALAYLARWAFDSNAAFFGVLAFDAALGGVVYWIALDSAATNLNRRREETLAAFGERGGPVAA
ncbi:MAG: hypothetical protein KIT09_26585 [Bryobacteraceae bacterium]|nr:hypothetical protein [Bryobacteraceae bacterium]